MNQLSAVPSFIQSFGYLRSCPGRNGMVTNSATAFSNSIYPERCGKSRRRLGRSKIACPETNSERQPSFDFDTRSPFNLAITVSRKSSGIDTVRDGIRVIPLTSTNGALSSSGTFGSFGGSSPVVHDCATTNEEPTVRFAFSRLMAKLSSLWFRTIIFQDLIASANAVSFSHRPNAGDWSIVAPTIGSKCSNRYGVITASRAAYSICEGVNGLCDQLDVCSVLFKLLLRKNSDILANDEVDLTAMFARFVNCSTLMAVLLNSITE
mmetsp:Transcript_28651/g.69411  ORF Transcript_28651/g.69411 Transcript_28651/m.69411 type:complete len:265 (-) Transcript_28651:2068-2862(-)